MVLFFASGGVAHVLGGDKPTQLEFILYSSLASKYTIVFLATFTAPFVEEFIYRGLLYAALGIVNPALNARIDWPWFIACQFVFGLVAGAVVVRHERIPTMQHLPFAVRTGIEAPGLMGEKNEEEDK